ncbi:3-deoxy-manno-octulosonate cytidylyltransferase [Methylophaga frappieri]|jgi:3-deoxy-manno-octulosonate cytidylyltransferase (CMP-KDO synthetase)|uniref:3-deoxy-manno-octulosonate cytidylyltransferase n=1 Tax=Methylophaga frappieri (strain ATCC BAA-2434 / DSM 25690 / JAM7) TaxID=754477 RepID=I1YHQ0_METFJ|nr:3-deoxy-manno-octulosonate cytidylyltransferase [Methylophaga frappieri]AFJ02443.1 3-deoxy-manno-octulosonate cytidylyltransferase [Methylophaga frappieri]
MTFRVVIPARYASTRLPGKPLREIAGKPMIQHVYERARESDASSVIIATDDQRIADVVSQFGGDICLTRANHQSGTDRLAEVVNLRQFDPDDIIVNVQGDEPCLPAALINQVAHDLAEHPKAAITSLFSRLSSAEQIFDSNIVKVLVDAQGYALYFSRAPVPWLRGIFGEDKPLPAELPHRRHIGLYAYRSSYLQRYTDFSPCDLEQFESLEQLRALYHGNAIHLTEATEAAGHGVDTESDLLIAEQLLRQQ